MILDLEVLKHLVAAHVPAFYLHEMDDYMPCSVDFFLQHSELCSGSQIVVARGKVDSQELLRAQCAQSHLHLNLDPLARTGESKHQLDGVPVYAHPKAIIGSDGNVEAIEITYLTLYAHNGAYTVAGMIRTGAHDGDWEHLTVRITPETGELTGVWFNAHRNRDGEWASPEKLHRDTESGRFIAYVALNGHGTYPSDGVIHRHFWLGNDRCSSQGPKWRPNKVVLLMNIDDSIEKAQEHMVDRSKILRCKSRGCLASQRKTGNHISEVVIPKGVVVETTNTDWVLFKGHWGSGSLGAPSPILQPWFHNAEPPISRGPWLRVFGHFWPERECL